MILIAKTNAIIHCSAIKAYSLVSNMERFHEWFPAVIAISSSNDLAHGELGKKYSERVNVPLMGTRDIEITVTGTIQNYYFSTEGQLPPLLPRMEIFITKESMETVKIDWAMYSRSSNKLVQLLLLPLIKGTMQKRAEMGMATLKKRLEQPL